MKKPNSWIRHWRNITDFPLLAETLHRISGNGSPQTLWVHSKPWWLWAVQAELCLHQGACSSEWKILGAVRSQLSVDNLFMDYLPNTGRCLVWWCCMELPTLLAQELEDSWSALCVCPGDKMTLSATSAGSKASPNKIPSLSQLWAQTVLMSQLCAPAWRGQQRAPSSPLQQHSYYIQPIDWSSGDHSELAASSLLACCLGWFCRATQAPLHSDSTGNQYKTWAHPPYSASSR